MRLRELSERIRHSLWFIPTVSVLLSAVAAIGMVALSSAWGQTGEELPIVFGAGPEGARAMLQAIAGSVITVAGVIFSITIVALQLTSTQFSPRVLRNFLRDRANQTVLGAFMGTFTYSLLVLRSIRAEDELRGPAFVPGPAITGGLVLAFVSLGMLIYFIHHISVRIQVTSILASVAGDALQSVERMAAWNETDDGRAWRAGTIPTPIAAAPPSGSVPPAGVPLRATMLMATESGYLQLVDIDSLVHDAREAGGRYSLLIAPGSWVQASAPVASFSPDQGGGAEHSDERHVERVARALSVGDERSLQQDAAFGIQQLVDIGVKALSPSINDPTTAMSAIDRVTDVMVTAGLHADAPRAFADADGVVRLEVPFPGFAELLALGLDQLRFYGAATPALALHLARALSLLRSSLPADRQPAVTEQARRLAEACTGIELERDRREALAAVDPLLQ